MTLPYRKIQAVSSICLGCFKHHESPSLIAANSQLQNNKQYIRIHRCRVDRVRYVHSTWGVCWGSFSVFLGSEARKLQRPNTFPTPAITNPIGLSVPVSFSHLSETTQTELLRINVIGSQCHSEFIIITVRKAKA